MQIWILCHFKKNHLPPSHPRHHSTTQPPKYLFQIWILRPKKFSPPHFFQIWILCQFVKKNLFTPPPPPHPHTHTPPSHFVRFYFFVKKPALPPSPPLAPHPHLFRFGFFVNSSERNLLTPHRHTHTHPFHTHPPTPPPPFFFRFGFFVKNMLYPHPALPPSTPTPFRLGFLVNLSKQFTYIPPPTNTSLPPSNFFRFGFFVIKCTYSPHPSPSTLALFAPKQKNRFGFFFNLQFVKNLLPPLKKIFLFFRFGFFVNLSLDIALYL